jgi:phosphatidylinositol N-acetylglucosaminyltransferase subunit A
MNDLSEKRKQQHSIAIVCDFFYPRLGGVEMHIWSLSQCLLRLGHRVCVISNLYSSPSTSTDSSPSKRVGVRIMASGLRVYYMNMHIMADQVILPTFTAGFPIFRKILLREQVTIVHGHCATSTFQHECIFQARTMGIRCCYTDHSLFSFHDFVGINVNKFLKLTLSDVEHCICPSHTCRENLVLRAAIEPHKVSTIPNAVDADKFTPLPSNSQQTLQFYSSPEMSLSSSSSSSSSESRNKNELGSDGSALHVGSIKEDSRSTVPEDIAQVTIVVISRLVYRKGIDLLVDVIPLVCKALPHVRFIVGGDGPKRLLLEEMRERNRLQDRVELLGPVPHSKVRDVLCRGQIFLNCSLTESFCIAVLEAACCGLHVVSTKVGGLPEVLPDHMIDFSNEVTPQDLFSAVTIAVGRVSRGEIRPWDYHREIREKSVYSWESVAKRTVIVYDRIASEPLVSLAERFRRLYSAGQIVGPIAMVLASMVFLYWAFLELVDPASDVDIVPFYSQEQWNEIEKCETEGSLKEAHRKADPLERKRRERQEKVSRVSPPFNAEFSVCAQSAVGFRPTSEVSSNQRALYLGSGGPSAASFGFDSGTIRATPRELFQESLSSSEENNGIITH